MISNDATSAAPKDTEFSYLLQSRSSLDTFKQGDQCADSNATVASGAISVSKPEVKAGLRSLFGQAFG